MVLGSERLTVQGFVDQLTSEGLTRYRFTDEEKGRRWSEVIMQLLEDEGYAEKGTTASLNQWCPVAAVDLRVTSTSINESFSESNFSFTEPSAASTTAK